MTVEESDYIKDIVYGSLIIASAEYNVCIFKITGHQYMLRIQKCVLYVNNSIYVHLEMDN